MKTKWHFSFSNFKLEILHLIFVEKKHIINQISNSHVISHEMKLSTLFTFTSWTLNSSLKFISVLYFVESALKPCRPIVNTYIDKIWNMPFLFCFRSNNNFESAFFLLPLAICQNRFTYHLQSIRLLIYLFLTSNKCII